MLSLNTLIIIIIAVIILAFIIGIYFLFIKKKAKPIVCKSLNQTCTTDKECCNSFGYSMRCSDISKTCIKCPYKCTESKECCNGADCISGICQSSPSNSCSPSGSNCPTSNGLSYNITINKGEMDKFVFPPLASSNCKYMFASDKLVHDYVVKEGVDLSTAQTNVNLFHLSFEPNFKTPSFTNYGNTVFISADGDIYLQALDYSGTGKTETVWSASTRKDGMWSKGSGPPYTLTLDDCGNLILTDSSNTITFTSKMRYFCNQDGTNCGWKMCNNNFKCGYDTSKNIYWCQCV